MKQLIVLIFMLLTAGAYGMKPINFKEITLPKSPNKYLMCPENYCNATANAQSPTFDVPAEQLKKQFDRVAMTEPRVTRITTSENHMQVQYLQRSRIFRFPDYIDVRFIPLSDNSSTLAIYSRSKYGHSDLGVNKARVQLWLKRLHEKISSKEKGQA